ncbi:MAG: hypothetical protein ACREU8_00195 [Gammaproteobacteria bacterium]
MKLLKHAILSVLLLSTNLTYAENPRASNYDAHDVAVETVILRPFGLIGTIVGTTLFVGTSPLTALASIAPQHDAFAKSAHAFIVTPFNYTFVRSFGDYTYD